MMPIQKITGSNHLLYSNSHHPRVPSKTARTGTNFPTGELPAQQKTRATTFRMA
jgi:hypothetical protein